MQSEQQLPASYEAEQSVIGGLLLENRAWDHVADILTAEDFFFARERILYQAISELSESGTPYDPVTISEWLGTRDLLDDAGGLAYIGTLAKNTPSAANIRHYCKIVKDYSSRRQLMRIGSEIINDATEAENVADAIDNAQALTMGIGEKSASKAPQSAGDLVKAALADIDQRMLNRGHISGISTGLADIDRRHDGLQPGDLVIVAGRPSMGKTTLAMNFAENVSLNGGSSLIFSMEMPSKQLIQRSLASVGRFNLQSLRHGDMSDEEQNALTAATGRLSAANMHIIDMPAMSPMAVRTMARRHKRQHGLDLVVVDYLQLMQAQKSGAQNRAEEIAVISRGLKSLALELNVPVVALSQLSRALEQRPNKRPIMSDLRESGAIEQDADVIIFLYRDEVYNPDTPDAGICEAHTAKFRNGAIGTDRLTSNLHMCRFDNFIKQDEWSI